MAKVHLKANQSSRTDSDDYLDQVNLEELTEFFYETEVLNVFGKQGKKAARAMASFFIAKTYLDLVINEEFDKNSNATIFYLNAENNETIH